MEDGRLSKQLFYEEFQCSKRPRHKPKKFLKDVINNNLKTLGMNFEDWQRTATNHAIWRRPVYNCCRMFEAMQLEHFILMQVLRSGRGRTSSIHFLYSSLTIYVVCVAGLVSWVLCGTMMTDNHVKNVSKRVKAEDLTCLLCNTTWIYKAGFLGHLHAHKRTF